MVWADPAGALRAGTHRNQHPRWRPGLDKAKAFNEDAGQGLVGLRDRVESLGGEFHVSTRPEGGTRLTASFEFAEADTEAPVIHA
jgi:hypothetical protein